MHVHNAGDVAWADLDPVLGTEQGKRRPVLVLTARDYNEKSGRAVICPITSAGESWPFNVPLPDGMKTKGVVLVDQMRAVDRRLRVFRKIESAPEQLVLEVRTMIATVLGIDAVVIAHLSYDV